MGQRRVHHQGRQQVNLRPEQVAEETYRRLQENRHEGRRQNENGMQPVHGIITHTSCSAPMSAASLTRASTDNP